MNRLQRAKRQRGVALLMVLVALTILGAMTADLMENNEVYLATAVNARDSVQAEYLARSGVNLSRLLLSFQKLLGSASVFPFWQYADMVIELFTGQEGGGALSDLAGLDLSNVEGLGLGINNSDLTVDILDEDSKLNVNLSNTDGRRGLREMMLNQLTSLFAAMEYDYLFERPIKTGDIVTREDLIYEILDWSDGDEDRCDLSGSEDPSYYQVLDPPYERKNAPFDSLMELHFVRGIDDDIWSTFVEPNPEEPSNRIMTVWGDGRVNVNTAPFMVLLSTVCLLAIDETGANPCMDLEVAKRLATILQGAMVYRQIIPFTRPRDFIAAINNPETMLLPIPGFPIKNAGRGILTTRSSVFSIYAIGKVGRVTKRIHMVVDTKNDDLFQMSTIEDMAKAAQTASAAGGKVLYWRME